MLELTALVLERFYHVGQLRTPPGPAAGPESRARDYTLHYDGRNELGFWWTDYETTLFTKMPVKSRDGTPWIVSVRASDYPLRATRSGKRMPGSMDETTKAFYGGFDSLLRYLPEVMRAKPPGQHNLTGGFLFTGTPPLTLTVDLKQVFRTLNGRKKVPLRVSWEKPETLVTVMANTFAGKREVMLRDWEKLHGTFYGYLEQDFQLIDMLAEDGPQVKLKLHAFRRLLRFLAKGRTQEDLNEHGQRVTLFPDAYAMGADAVHRGGVVMLAAKGPRLPADVLLHKGAVETIAKWLLTVSQDTELKTGVVVMTDLTATKKPRYGFRDPTGRYRLWVSAARTPFLRLPVDRILAILPRFAIEVNRGDLQKNAKMFGALSYDRALVCRVVGGSDGKCQIHMEAKHDDSHSHGLLDAVLHAGEGEVFTGWSFTVSARDILCALGHFSAKEVFLVSRPSVQSPDARQLDYGGRQLAICAAKPTGADWKTPIVAAFVRIVPEPVPGAALAAVATKEPPAAAAGANEGVANSVEQTERVL
jgi:hypothetical protein